MKTLVVTMISLTASTTLMAREINPHEEIILTASAPIEEFKAGNYNQEMKVTYLTKLLEHQQKAYDEKISFLETELRKTKDRLIEKSMNQEKLEEAMVDKYSAETIVLKKELAYKEKALMVFQRQMEKIKPTEELKNMIKLNTEMAAELRRSEDQIAIIELKNMEKTPGMNTNSRLPASVPTK